ncbi:polyketide cyclase [Pseudooceanicola sediminis]|uniref:Polyketide cyclase n=1 Tax=Pseudooceanicola sediminis TaxID=2211117 RepID=A0A399J4P6_9RHOB|nr:SRPBCC family protein [Pseudooceanicola sediminis]KAA2314666.1 SRPBCC family protein [Puniceibacterium sp. HSS470]RII39379.1 polyketide cyclase [Pseudooceanicola sediminis]|tara:strand:+ start:243724 stop:244188 length:465 start_codon:yes stop_codon:yes gene_type:complete
MTSDLDLHLSRIIPASPDAVWRCWSEAELLMQWFTPKPVETVEAVIEPRSGGRFYTKMQLPDGTEIASEGCVLAADPGRLLSFTDALGAGYRPTGTGFMTAIVTFDPVAEGTRYSAMVLHATLEERARHEEMGFHEGWGAAADQLADLAKKISG